MGFDGIYSVYHRNEKTQKYEKLAFYDKNGKELCTPFPTRDGMLNQLLLDYNRHGFSFESIGAHRGLPDWYIDILKEEHCDWFDSDDYNTDEHTYYDYLELMGWKDNPYCNQVDWYTYENEENCGDIVIEKARRNPLISFMAQVNVYLEAYNIYYPKPGEVIIICEASY